MDLALIPFFLIAAFTLISAAVALFLRNIIRAALLLTASWVGIGAFYLWAGAEFIAFAQVLVYVGAISMVVLFVVLLTGKTTQTAAVASRVRSHFWGIYAAMLTGIAIGVSVSITDFPLNDTAAAPVSTVREIGEQLMTTHVGALLIVGVLLTVALLGAIVLAAPAETDEP